MLASFCLFSVKMITHCLTNIEVWALEDQIRTNVLHSMFFFLSSSGSVFRLNDILKNEAVANLKRLFCIHNCMNFGLIPYSTS